MMVPPQQHAAPQQSIPFAPQPYPAAPAPQVPQQFAPVPGFPTGYPGAFAAGVAPTPTPAAYNPAVPPNQEPPAAAQQLAPPTPPPAPAPLSNSASPVTLPAELAQQLYADRLALEQLRRQQAEQQQQQQFQQALLTAQKGNAEAALTQFREQAEARYTRMLETVREAGVTNEIAMALGGVQLRTDVPGLRDQVATVLRTYIQPHVDESGMVHVRGRDGRPAGEVLRELLSGPAFAHCRAPAHMGGAATAQAPQAPPAYVPAGVPPAYTPPGTGYPQAAPGQQQAQTGPPRNLGEWIMGNLTAANPQGVPQVAKSLPFEF
jgi:hypothetical protein